MRSPIMQRLKEETRPYHDQLEANPRSKAVLGEAVTLPVYLDLLQHFYGFYVPLEHQLSQIDWRRTTFDFQSRRKVSRLEADLRYFGIGDAAQSALHLCADVPQVASLAQAVGTLYVIEGATLGGQIIRRHLWHTLQLDADSGASFFCSYGDRVGAMWQAFMAFATECAITPDIENEMVAAAVKLFQCLETWLSEAHLVPTSG